MLAAFTDHRDLLRLVDARVRQREAAVFARSSWMSQTPTSSTPDIFE
jgi:hypothetical protein